MATPSNNNFDPASIGATPVAPSFDPASLGATPVNNTSPLASFAGSALNFIDNNPISHALTSLTALPVQGLAKVLHQPDPFAHGTGNGGTAPAPVSITSSDQPLGKFAEEEAGNAATVGSLFVPAGALGDAVTGGRGFLGSLGRIGANSVVGAGMGAASGMQNGQSASQVMGDAGTGALFGGGLSAGGEIGGAMLNKFASNTGESRLIAQKNNLKSVGNAFNDASTQSTNPITTMEQNNLTKDLRVIDGKINVEGLTNPSGTGSLDNLVHEQQEMGTQAVAQMPGGVPTMNFKNTVVSAIKNDPFLKASGKVGKMLNEIDSRFKDYQTSYGDEIPYKDLNQVRVAMNKSWNPETWDAEKAIGNASRNLLYHATGAGKALKSAMANEQELINAKEFIQKLAGTAVKGGKFGKYIAEGAGAVVGSIAGTPIPVIGPGIGGAVGAAATGKAMNIAQSNYFKPVMAGPARTIQSLLTGPTAQVARRTGKQLLISSATQGVK